MNSRLIRFSILTASVMSSAILRADFTPDWQALPCCADDVSVGADGTVWIVGHAITGNGDVFRWSGSVWVKQEGLEGDAIAVDPQGLPWIANHSGDIFRPSGGTWVKAPGKANDIAIGADGSVWICGYNRNADLVVNGDVFKWDGNTWVKSEGVKGVHLAVDPSGEPTIVNTDGDIFKRANGAWFKVTGGQAGDVGNGADGTAWITGTRPDGVDHDVYRWTGNTFERALGGEGTRISVAPNGEPWLVNASGEIFVGHTASPPTKPVIDVADVTVGPTGVSVGIDTVSGSTYLLETKATVDAALWQAVDSKAGTGASITLRDARPPTGLGFYRVHVTTP
jgi:hypothetical protein